jgi:sugar/nucleoside kinase (ribokinase family)
VIVCLGEALVDLICERAVRSFADADAFTPHFGGALANVAVAASRAGAHTALAGGAGDDEWGRWLRDRLEAEGVELRWFDLLDGAQTPVAFAAIDERGDASFQIYGEAIADAVVGVGPQLEVALRSADSLVFGSVTLAEPEEREVTLQARELALERGVRVCFDPNVRPNRWGGHPERAIAISRELIPGSYLVRANREEAMDLAEVDDPRKAAGELAAMGAELAVVTLGEEGAVIRGPARRSFRRRASRSSRPWAPATPSWAPRRRARRARVGLGTGGRSAWPGARGRSRGVHSLGRPRLSARWLRTRRP